MAVRSFFRLFQAILRDRHASNYMIYRMLQARNANIIGTVMIFGNAHPVNIRAMFDLRMECSVENKGKQQSRKQRGIIAGFL